MSRLAQLPDLSVFYRERRTTTQEIKAISSIKIVHVNGQNYLIATYVIIVNGGRLPSLTMLCSTYKMHFVQITNLVGATVNKHI